MALGVKVDASAVTTRWYARQPMDGLLCNEARMKGKGRFDGSVFVEYCAFTGRVIVYDLIVLRMNWWS